MSNKGVIIQGSSRAKGNTRRLVDFVNSELGFEVIDLAELNIGHFDYDFENRDDDYLPTMRTIIEKHNTIVFATPVYWYAMSGLMKDFFDRITDLLRTEKELGRRLRGMNMALISCSSDSVCPALFEMPFVESANYLGMNYLGDVHGWIEEEKIPESLQNELKAFAGKLIA
jgi:multimeric flavodoxin WrbA